MSEQPAVESPRPEWWTGKNEGPPLKTGLRHTLNQMENRAELPSISAQMPASLAPRSFATAQTCFSGDGNSPPEGQPAISANPYIQFKFKATESGPVVLTWIDDDGSTIVGEDSIKVL